MMTGTLRVRRRQGALSGVLLVLLGIWGALIPFVGPYFHYAYRPDSPWVATAGRMWLEVLPGVVALAGGIVVLISRFRPAAVLAAWLAALAGAWFAVGDLIAGHWARLPAAGTPVGGAPKVVLEQIGFFTGLGVVIVFVAALALGRFTVVAARDAAAARVAGDSPAAEAATAGAAPTGKTTPGAGPRPRSVAQVKAVPVFRGRRSGAAADTADAAKAAGSTSAEPEADAARAR
jgi:hypothetical protein